MTEAKPVTAEVVETLSGKYINSTRVGRHAWTADEPVAAGGNDAGPSPYEFLLLALGACTSMTVRMYAERKQWSLKRVRVRLEHRKVHAQDCADCATKEPKLDEITREIVLEGELNEEQRQKLLEIANKCPVHRTLSTPIAIRSKLAPSWAPRPWDAD
jgi:putative redox protein